MALLTENEFNTHIRKVVEAFPSAFSQRHSFKIELIWESCKNLQERDFEYLVTKVLKTCKQAPSVAEFEEMARPLRNKNAVEREVKGSCGECEDGLFFQDFEDSNPVVWKCRCELGTQRPERYQTWRG